MTYSIHPANRTHLTFLSEAYLHMLDWLASQQYLILPTKANVERLMTQHFVPAIADGRSAIMVAENDDNGFPVAALYWVIDATPLDTRYATATSFGQWVDPRHRGHGLVPRMVEEAKKRLHNSSVRKVFDMCHTPESHEAAEACGFKTECNVVTLTLA